MSETSSHGPAGAGAGAPAPRPGTPGTPGTPGAPGTPTITPTAGASYPVAGRQHLATAAPHKTARPLPWVLLGAVVLLLAIVGIVLAVVLAPQPLPPCGQRCTPGGPPPGPGSQLSGGEGALAPPALHAPRTSPMGPLTPRYGYTSSKYGYSLEYNPRYAPTSTNDHQILWSYHSRSTGAPYQWGVTAGSASGQSADQIVAALQQQISQDASHVYDVPAAEIGYAPGAATVYDTTYAPATGPTVRMRLVIVVAVKNDLAIAGLGLAPFVRDTQGHPNPAQTGVVFYLDPIVNSVVWPGSRPL